MPRGQIINSSRLGLKYRAVVMLFTERPKYLANRGEQPQLQAFWTGTARSSTNSAGYKPISLYRPSVEYEQFICSAF